MKTAKYVAILLASLATIGAAGRASGQPPARTAEPTTRYICAQAFQGAALPATHENIMQGACVIDDLSAKTSHAAVSEDYWYRLAQKRLRLLRKREHRIVELLAAKRKRHHAATAPSRGGSGWISGYATWYGPGFYGSSPACGGPGLTESSWWVATVPLRCGAMVTVCASRCVRAPARDTGAFPSSNLDLTPAVARATGGLFTKRVRWRVG